MNQKFINIVFINFNHSMEKRVNTNCGEKKKIHSIIFHLCSPYYSPPPKNSHGMVLIIYNESDHNNGT